MITQPTTDQILADCAREVRETLLPAIDDPNGRVHLEMLDQILQACAVRAAHEIAWMREESEAMVSFAQDVATAHPGEGPLGGAIAAYRRTYDAPGTTLQLDDQVQLYDLAGQAFSVAVAIVVGLGAGELGDRARMLILSRNAHEAALRMDFHFPGRV